MEETIRNFRKRDYSLMLKIALIGFLMLILLIPLEMVKSIIYERENLNAEVQRKIGDTWGASQILVTPLLAIPYTSMELNADKKLVTVNNTLYYSAADCNVKSSVSTELKKRSIFHSIVYTNKLQLDGTFDLNKIAKQKDFVYDYANAYLIIGMSDPTAISSKTEATWNGKEIEIQPGTLHPTVVQSGVHSICSLDEKLPLQNFSINLELRGSNSFSIFPASISSTLSMDANWPSPSFEGKILPKKHNITAKGFTSEWVSTAFNNELPRQWSNNNYVLPLYNDNSHQQAAINMSNSNLTSFATVKFIETANDYQKNMRTAKYAFLIISLSFLVFFAFEMANKISIHPIQYILIGLGLVMFYLLLISITEHLGFNTAYLISSIAIILLILGYSKSVLYKTKSIAILGLLLIFVYSYIFVLLQLEDYALLVGACGLFIILALIMMISRKINWYEIGALHKVETPN
jgi:inner membrane protein